MRADWPPRSPSDLDVCTSHRHTQNGSRKGTDKRNSPIGKRDGHRHSTRSHIYWFRKHPSKDPNFHPFRTTYSLLTIYNIGYPTRTISAPYHTSQRSSLWGGLKDNGQCLHTRASPTCGVKGRLSPLLQLVLVLLSLLFCLLFLGWLSDMPLHPNPCFFLPISAPLDPLFLNCRSQRLWMPSAASRQLGSPWATTPTQCGQKRWAY